MFFKLLIFAFLLTLLNFKVQAKYLDTLQSQLRFRYNSELSQQLNNLHILRQNKWLKWLPSLGWNLILNTPSISLATPQILTFLQFRDNNEFQIAEAKRLNRVNFVNDSITLDHSYYQLIYLLDDYKNFKEMYEVDSLYYLIQQDKHKSLAISTEVYLTELKKWLSVRRSLVAYHNSIISQINIIENLTKKPFRRNETAFIFLPSNLLSKDEQRYNLKATK